ncbi:Putative transcriptional regulator, TetR family [Mycobacteroides abscessus subsp. abscessus]|nr:Putative transcriptional regulator, TetR family [Mycobacteroides abscessus subsp. abscessus]
MEGIAKAAGVAKQTVYRWWSSKADVLMDVFLEDAACQLDPPDLGGLEADLRHHLSATAQFLAADDASRSTTGSSRTTSAGDTCASSRPEIRFRSRARWRAANCRLAWMSLMWPSNWWRRCITA